MVESDPNNTQRWRIAFEDIDNWNLPPTTPTTTTRTYSLWATKRFGYDINNDGIGDGWRDVVRTVITPNADKPGRYNDLARSPGRTASTTSATRARRRTSRTRSSWSRSADDRRTARRA